MQKAGVDSEPAAPTAISIYNKFGYLESNRGNAEDFYLTNACGAFTTPESRILMTHARVAFP